MSSTTIAVANTLQLAAPLLDVASPKQRVFNNVALPLYLVNKQPQLPLADICALLSREQAAIQQLLDHHGTLLFRGFPIKTASDFNEFVQAFKGYEDLPYEQSLSFAVRLPVVGRVCTTNEGKTGGQVFHHEQAQTPAWPSKLFFYCEQPATVGGGTAVCPSDEVLQRLTQKYPEFIQKLEALGVRYTATMQAKDDPSIGVGRSWKSFFGRDTRESVEARMKELGYSWEWLPEDVLKCTSPVLSAVREAPGCNGRRVFFNQLPATVANAMDFHNRSANKDGVSTNEVLSRYLTFGDGSRIDVEILLEAKALCEETAVEMEWQQGDVALLDNYLVMHARRPFEGPRRVLASLVK